MNNTYMPLTPPSWTLEEKTGLTMQVLGTGKKARPMRGRFPARCIDSCVQILFRLIIPVNQALPAAARWDQLRKGFFRFGSVSRLLGRLPLLGNLLVGTAGRLVSRMTVRNAFWGINPRPLRRPEAIANEYLKFAEGIGLEIDYQHSSAGEDAALVCVSHCSAGVFKEFPRRVCRAMNEMDHEIVRLLGGVLETTQTIAATGRSCRFRISTTRSK